ncbi:hypothetical protein ACFTXJ_37670 [Streptomyces zhihengii]|uniref:hypothetical protein n=1 Tax=Streptomyces zhihengii TaxID=1818004 RepID=UPI00364256A9
MRTSPHATVLGAPEGRVPDLDTLAAQLTEMREQRLPTRVRQKDAGDQKRVARLHGQAAAARQAASMYRTVTSEARTEKALRERIAQQHPELHRSETQARAEVQQARQARTTRIQQHNRRHEPSALNRFRTQARTLTGL